MRAKEALILWTSPNSERHPDRTGQVAVYRVDSSDGEAEYTRHDFKGGAVYVAVRRASGDGAIARLFIEFQTMVLRDGIDPHAAHKAFLVIDEYREACAPELQADVAG